MTEQPTTLATLDAVLEAAWVACVNANPGMSERDQVRAVIAHLRPDWGWRPVPGVPGAITTTVDDGRLSVTWTREHVAARVRALRRERCCRLCGHLLARS